MSLPILVFMINCIRSNWLRKFNFIFCVNCMWKICHIIILFGLCHRLHPVQLVIIIKYSFRQNHTYKVDHVIVLSCFIIDHTWSDRFRQFSYDFDVDPTYIIDHNIIMLGFRHGLHLIRIVTTTQYCFWHRSYLYNKSCCCPVWFLLKYLTRSNQS